ncbi:GNAT family N-acetyltransferase [Allopusillimonas soli]|uniref:GNAT family N-acetyltransferase n=1 Tax=Allopusillimonas soli TaxID=659016 RepID=A0A853F861_9BURK|nr:GNAT family N-acetyltransferase [Allopusillimonas soli]NYT36149.1 GNAT family N-acetyltransferase [Allopusillimonas soli]TEA76483.1 GNAT family N-acetyltransferase [Allopusillimonas soli]
MLRHRLAALFEPRTVMVVADRTLPLDDDPPRWLAGSHAHANVAPGQPIALPPMPGLPEDERLDQALLCVPPERLPEALAVLKPLRPRCVVLLPHVQAPADPLEDMIYCRAWGRLNDCLVLGPHSLGVQRPHLGLNLSQLPRMALGGRVALVAQSRSIASAVLDWAQDINMGFSAVVSLGDEAGLDLAQVLDYLALDARTNSIALYLEEASSSRDFGSALRAAASIKPVVVLKAGHAADAHTTEDAAFNALLRRAGAVRIRYFVQLFSAIKVLGYAQRPRGRRIALFSNGGGAPQLALDVMGDGGSVVPAALSSATLKALGQILTQTGRVGNPVLTYTNLTPVRVRQVIDVLVADAGVDGVLVLLSPDPLSDLEAVARELADIAPAARKPIVTCFMGDATMRPLRHMLDAVGTPAFRTPESAANAFGILGAYHYNQTLAQQTLPPEPLGKPPRLEEARALVREVREAGRLALSREECVRLLSCFHVPLIHISAADARGRDIDDEDLPMAIRVRRDDKFGPYITFGSGGQDALLSESNRTLELPPLNRYLARQLVQRSTLWRKALSRRLQPAVYEILLESLEHISGLVSDVPDLLSLTIDPLISDDTHLLALGVRGALSRSPMLVLPEHSGYRHMAIHPYPRRLVQAKAFKNGQPWLLRPIRPEDAEILQTFIRGLSDESRYMRFVSMLRELTPRMLERYTRIDYDRELALVATVLVPNPEHRGHPREEIIGFAHYLRNADGRGAEYALVIGDAWQRHGLGAQLMRALIEAAREQGLAYIDGVVLATNRPMLSLMAHLGFRNDVDSEDPTMRRVWLDLGDTRQH